MKRRDSGIVRNLPKHRNDSRLLQCWLAQRLAQTAPTDSRRLHSWLPSSTHPPNNPLLWELETAGQNGSPMSDQLLCKGMPTVMHHKGGPFLMFPLLRSSSSSLNGFPWKYSTHNPGVSRRRLWSWAEWRLPWKCRNTSWCPIVSTPDSQNGLAYWQRLMVLSRRTCQAQLPRTLFSCEKFSLTESCWCLSHLRWCPTSRLPVGFVMALASACSAFSSVLLT